MEGAGERSASKLNVLLPSEDGADRPMIDYDYSKRLGETLEQWGRKNVLRDVVPIIRIDRPLVLISRFQGNQRDGHGNHQAAGPITQEAYKAAADPAMFTEQIKAGLRPWHVLKLYIGGVRENEALPSRLLSSRAPRGRAGPSRRPPRELNDGRLRGGRLRARGSSETAKVVRAGSYRSNMQDD